MNQENLKAWFTQFNRDYFNGELPEPRLLISRSRTRLGSCSYKRQFSWGRTKYSQYTIRVSTYYDCGEYEWKNILLHEMIHLYIASKRLRDTSSHGRLFRQYMEHLNNTYGWNIRITTDTHHWQTTKKTEKQKRTVLALRMKNGKHFVTVVNPQYISTIKRQLEHVANIEESRWIETDDDFFRNFSIVRSLRGRYITAQQFHELLRSSPILQND